MNLSILIQIWIGQVLFFGKKALFGAYGYSRDHRLDKKQVTFGISELANPINIPIGLTIERGNVNNQEHFQKTFSQVQKIVKKNIFPPYSS